MDEICGLFKLAGLSGDGVKKKVFPLSLEGKALTWYRLCDDTGTWDWNRLKLELHQKFYPMHLVHHDRNYIYNFWPREGESIAQAWGRHLAENRLSFPSAPRWVRHSYLLKGLKLIPYTCGSSRLFSGAVAGE